MSKKSANRSKLVNLGKRIQELRIQNSISQEKLADLAGVHRTYVGMIERGEKNMTIRSVEKIATALGVTLSELFDGFENG